MEETADAHSVSFAVPEGAEAEFDYKPGQFLTLAVPSDQTGVAARCYSLSSCPHDGGPLTVTVKRTAEGYASNWICDHLREGSTIRSLPPSGIFTPASLDADLLLFAGGSGITPVMSITRTAIAHGSGKIMLFYANRDETLGDLRLRAGRAGRRAPAPAGRRALAGVGAGAAQPGADEGVHRAVRDLRRLRVRAGAVHEADRSRRCASWSSRASGATRRSSSRWAATRSATRRSRPRPSTSSRRPTPTPASRVTPRRRRSTSPPRARPRAGSGSRSSSTARPTPTTTGRRPPSCSSTWSRRA